MSVQTDFSFPTTYACELLDELPGGDALERFFFPGGMEGGRDGVIVRVRPEGREPWIGTFAFGTNQPAGVTRILSMPDPTRFCVVARGAGYVVTARTPDSWEPVKAVPVTDVHAVPAAGVVVFANFTELVAYEAGGVRWRTKRLAWDGLKILEVTEQAITGEYWNIQTESMQRFEVDLATGFQRGGAEQ